MLTLDAGEAHGLTVAIDTGSTQSLALSAADAMKVFPMGWGKSLESVAMTADKQMHSLEVRVPLVDIRGLESRDVLANVELPDPKAAEARTSQIGCGLLHRYRAIFDFPGGKLTLIERPHPPADEADMSGLAVLRNDGVVSVRRCADTPAGAAGIRVGEILTAIDGTTTDKLPMATIRQRLRAGDGKTARLDLKDGDTERTVEITLARRI